MEFKLIDGEERARKYPTSFHIPSKAQKESVQIGERVKIGFEKGERLWVEITKVTRSIYGKLVRLEGRLRNHPIVIPMKYDDEVKFGPRHILDIEEKLNRNDNN